METKINIAKAFSPTPGARYKTDGEFSGEEFRERFLEPLFQDPKDDSPITIIFDGAEGYATSFLEEAFGGLARKFGSDRCIKKLKFLSKDDPTLEREIMEYIKAV